MKTTTSPCFLIFSLGLRSLVLEVGAGRRVIDRFPGSRYPIPDRCIFAFPSLFSVGDSLPLGKLMMDEIEPFMRRFRLMNCSFPVLPYSGSGLLDSNGSYDGAIGYIQRNEVDVIFGIFRSDFF